MFTLREYYYGRKTDRNTQNAETFRSLIVQRKLYKCPVVFFEKRRTKPV